MRHDDGVITAGRRRFCEEAVTQLPGGHFDADAVFGSIGPRIETCDVAGDPVRLRPFPDEGLVPVALRAAEAEIAVGDPEGSPIAEVRLGEAHRVDAAADAEEVHYFFDAKV